MPITPLNDSESVEEQYKDSSNIQKRLDLHRRFSVNQYHWHPWVFDRLDLPERCRILELGCGTGALWEENIERIPPAWDVTLSDFSEGMLEGTWRKLEKLHSFQYKVIDAQSIPFGKGTFDAVIANHMLYHVPDREAALREIRRVLVPGGRFYASTNGRRHLTELAALLVKFDPALAEWGVVGAEFTLENGLEQLTPWFKDIRLERYADALNVTEVAPLMDYVLSGWAAAIVGDRREEFKEFLCRELEARNRRLHITKDAGLFMCVRRESRKGE